MFRTRLEETQGMLFFFPDGERPSFWMKHTFLALDLLFLSKDGQVLDLVEQMPPCAMDPCPTYVSRHPAAFALELKGGFVAAHGVRRGDRVRLEIRD